jgi:hypothetical protein
MRLNLSQHAFAEIPDELPLTANNKLNIIFQYRWHAAAPPDKSNIKAVYIYADHPELNSGNPGELGSVEFINKSLDKILDKTKAELGRVGLSAYSGGGLGLYHLFKCNIRKVDAIIMSDANYGGKPTLASWKLMSEKYIDSTEQKFVLFHTRSLAKSFDSTTITANLLIKSLDMESYVIPINESDDFWKDWYVKPTNWAVNGGLTILDSEKATHADAGKLVPSLLNSFLIDWNA